MNGLVPIDLDGDVFGDDNLYVFFRDYHEGNDINPPVVIDKIRAGESEQQHVLATPTLNHLCHGEYTLAVQINQVEGLVDAEGNSPPVSQSRGISNGSVVILAPIQLPAGGAQAFLSKGFPDDFGDSIPFTKI